MKCNPSRWLWGVLPVAIWSWVTVLGENDRIETDLRQRAAEALKGSGLNWAMTGFAGRDGTLSGLALDESEPAKAAELARKVWGVRVVDNRAELVEKIDNYIWSAALNGGRIQLGGFVPNEEARKAVLAAVAASFPKSPVSDAMKLARGAPSMDVWNSGVGFALKQLADLKNGAVELNGTSLSVTGEASDFPSYKNIKKSLQKLPQGMKLVSEKVTPPVVNPFTWSAKLASNQLALSGYVPSEKLREDLFAQVKKSFPKVAIVDRMEIADGAPEGWANLVVATLAGLAQLQDGEAVMTGRDLSLTGTAQNEAIANSARAVFRKDAPKSYKLTDSIRFTEETLAVVSPYVTSIAAQNNAVRLTGSVPSEQARAAMIAAVKARLPGHSIDDKMQLAAGAPDGWQSCLAASVSGIARLGSGNAQLSDRQLKLNGETGDEALAAAVPGEVRAAANRACDADVQIAVLTEPEPNLTWRAVHGAAGEIVLEGDVPDEQTRREILQNLGKYFPSAKAVDRMTIANAKSRKWGQVADLGLRALARLRRGEVVLSRQELVVRGEASDTAVAGTVKDQIAREVAKGYTARDIIDIRSDAMLWAEAEAKKKAEAQKIADDAEAKRKAADTTVNQKRNEEAKRCETLLRTAAAEGTVQFDRASADLSRASMPTLNQLVKIANSCPDFQITIDGHTDAEGTDERNQRLSDRRARAVADYLIAAGVAAARVTATGYGASQPIAPNDTPQDRAKNRRIEFGVKAN